MDDPDIVPTSNGFGWTSAIPNPTTLLFLEFVEQIANALVIDIGAGLGVASLPAMQAGACVIVNDIDSSHLMAVASEAKVRGLANQCRPLLASLPDLPDLEPLDAIHASNVLHFLSGDQLARAAAWMFSALKPSGRAYMQMQSPFCGHFRAFYPRYQMRVKRGDRWPGEIDDAKRYAPAEIAHLIANFNHVLDGERVVALFEANGFEVLSWRYYRRPGLPLVSQNDGRENLGVVVRKP
jgi:hypothetical protein